MKKEILVVFASKALRYLLQTMLEKHFKVIAAEDGSSALFHLTNKKQPELIITDTDLPDLESWELVEQLASSGLYQDIPMIVISSEEKNELSRKASQHGIMEYFQKPFNPVDLLACVNRTVEHQTLEAKVQAG